LNVPKEYALSTAIGTVTISHNGVPAGNIKFKLKIAEGRLTGNFAPTQAKSYRKAFISYASENRNEVLKRTQALSAAGLEIFQDVTNLKPGDAWEPELYRQIDSTFKSKKPKALQTLYRYLLKVRRRWLHLKN